MKYDTSQLVNQLVEQVKNNDNKYKNKLKNLLECRGNEKEISEFRFHLSQLYIQLESHTIPNGINRLSFNTIWAVDSNLDSYTFDSGTYSYKIQKIVGAARGAKQYKIEVINKNGGATTDIIELFKKDLNELDANADFVGLSTETKKSKVRECLSHVLRHMPANFVKSATATGRKPAHSIVIDERIPLYLSDDINLDAQAIIQLFVCLTSLLIIISFLVPCIKWYP